MLHNRSIFMMGLALATVYWLFETMIHHWVFDPSMSFLCCLFPSDPNELWMRINGVLAISTFGFITQLHFNKMKLLYHEKSMVQEQLEKALAKTLSGFLSICANCKKISVQKEDEEKWVQIESYIHDHSSAEFSHTMCPGCNEKLYGNYLKNKDHPKDIES